MSGAGRVRSTAGSTSYETCDSIQLVGRLREEEEEEAVSINPGLPLVSIRIASFVHGYKFRKLPRGKAVWLVFLMFFFHGIAEFSTTLILFFALNAYHRLNPPQTVAVYLIARCSVFTMYPVMGFLADTVFSRYRVLLASLHISWVGSALFALVFAFVDPWLDSDPDKYAFGTDASWPKSNIWVLALCYGIMWIGLTGIRVNLIPFGVDQIPDASSGELSSYFHWYYWFINAGYLVVSAGIPFLYTRTALSYTFLITNSAFSCQILILLFFKHKLQILPKIGNPLKQIYKVLRYAAKAKRPRYRSAFQVGLPPPSRLDLAMETHGGTFSIEQVEDVKTFFRILFVLISFFGYFAVYSQLQSTYLMESIRMQPPAGIYKECPKPIIPTGDQVNGRHVECQYWKAPPSLWLAIANVFPVLILIPFFDRVVYPIFVSTPTMLRRIGVGKVFLLTSIAVATGVECFRTKQLTDFLWNNQDNITINAIPFHTGGSTTLHVASPAAIELIIPQYFLFAFAEVLSNITAVEFIYAQSPAYMKSFLLGLLFGTEGLAMGFASLFIGLQNTARNDSFFSFFGNTNYFYTDVTSPRCTAKLQNGIIANQCLDSPLFSYIILLAVTLISVSVFVVNSLRYKFRRRDADPYVHPWNHGPDEQSYRLCASCCS